MSLVFNQNRSYRDPVPLEVDTGPGPRSRPDDQIILSPSAVNMGHAPSMFGLLNGASTMGPFHSLVAGSYCTNTIVWNFPKSWTETTPSTSPSLVTALRRHLNPIESRSLLSIRFSGCQIPFSKRVANTSGVGAPPASRGLTETKTETLSSPGRPLGMKQ